MSIVARPTRLGALALLLAVAACSPDRPTLTEATTSPAATALGGLEVRVSLASDVTGNAPVTAQVTIFNRATFAVEVPESQLPSEDMESMQFVVRREGQRVAYEGPHIKRGPILNDALIRIAPGASYTYDVELSRAYDFSRDGRYTVAFESRSGVSGAATLQSAAQELRISGRTAPVTNGVVPRTPTSLTSLVSYSRCTATQQTDVLAALNQAEAYAGDAKTYLAGNTMGERFTWWFGAATTASVNTMRSHFAAIADAFATKPVTVDCGCKKTYYAYVYPNQPYTIYVCKAFWNAPLAGTDSRGGTLIHEMSHFNVVAATDDWAYGQTNARSLALSDPTKAIDNADSHEYFAENTPKRP